MHAKTYRHLVRNNYPEAEYRQIDPIGWVPVVAGAPVLVDNFIPTDVGAGKPPKPPPFYTYSLRAPPEMDWR